MFCTNAKEQMEDVGTLMDKINTMAEKVWGKTC